MQRRGKEELEMQALGGGHRFAELLQQSWRRSTTLRAFSSSSSFYSNQSRGGLPRFFSEVLPPSKGAVIRVQGDELWHMTKVLRLSVDDRALQWKRRIGGREHK